MFRLRFLLLSSGKISNVKFKSIIKYKFEKNSEDGSKNCSRKPLVPKLAARLREHPLCWFVIPKNSERWRYVLVHKFGKRWR